MGDKNNESLTADNNKPQNKRWYVVHTYSNMENKAKESLLERIAQYNLQDFFGEILIPTEKVESLRSGQKITQSRKFFPGYILVNMEVNKETLHLVKNTMKVTGFVGNSQNPSPLTEKEVYRLLNMNKIAAEKPRAKIEFSTGEEVKVIDGAFANFVGTVEEIKPDKEKVRVMVPIFGRLTPVELDYIQVEKMK